MMDETRKQTIALFSFVWVLFLTGVVCGALLVNALTEAQRQEVQDVMERYVASFFPTMHTTELVAVGWWERVRFYGQWIVMIALLGVSVVGVPLIGLIDFLKGVMVGFTLSMLIGQWSWAGLVIGLVSIIPHHLILLPALWVSSVVALSSSLWVLRTLLQKIPRMPRQKGAKQWWLAQLGCFGAIAIASWIETQLTPLALQRVIPWVLGNVGS